MDPYSPDVGKHFSRLSSKQSREKSSNGFTRRRGFSINHQTKSNSKVVSDDFGYRVTSSSIQSTQRSFGGKRTPKGTETSFDLTRTDATLDEISQVSPLAVEKNALNFLKMLSMEDESENPVEKEIDNLISPEELCEPLKIVNKRKKELAMYHKFLESQELDSQKPELRDITSSNNRTPSGECTKVNSLQLSKIDFKKNGSFQQEPEGSRSKSNDGTSSMRQTKRKSFMAPRQEPLQSPPSPTKLAHLYKLSPRAMKNRKPREIDRRLKLFCYTDENDDSFSSKSRVLTKGEAKTPQSFKIRRKTSYASQFKEQANSQKENGRDIDIFQLENQPNPFEDFEKEISTRIKTEKEVASKIFSKILANKTSGGSPAPIISRELPHTFDGVDIFTKSQKPTFAALYKQELPKTLQEIYSKGNVPNNSVFYPTPQNQFTQSMYHSKWQTPQTHQLPLRK